MNNELLGFLCTIFTSALFAIGHAGTVKDASYDMIADAWQVSDPTAPNYNSAVLLEVVVNARYVSCNFLAVGESDTSDLSQSGVGFLGRLCPDYQTHAPFLRRAADVGYTFSTLGFRPRTSD